MYRSAYQWARRGYRPIHGTRSELRGSIGQPLFGIHQVTFVGVYSAMNQHTEWLARNQAARLARQVRPASYITVDGKLYREV